MSQPAAALEHSGGGWVLGPVGRLPPIPYPGGSRPGG
jgi:hypothetical protein